jgi:ADP-heptose:LPS heptosyltransferase
MPTRKFPIQDVVRKTRRILFIYWAPFGDTIIVTPLLKRLREFFPGAAITYITNYPLYLPFGPSSRVIEQNPHIDECIISHKMLLAQLLARKPYDLAIDLVDNSYTGMLSHLSGAAFRVWGEFRGEPHTIYWASRDPDGGWSDTVRFRIPSNKKLCRVKHILEVARAMGIPQGADIRPRVYLSKKERAGGRAGIRRVAGGARPVIAIHPGGHLKHRLWHHRNYAELCGRLIGELGARVVIFQGPREASFVKRIRSACPYPVPVIQPENLRRYFSLVAQSDLFISTDGGPLHMALALDVRSVGIFKSRIIRQYWYEPHYDALLSSVFLHPGQFRRSRSGVDAVFRRAARVVRGRSMAR